MAPPSGKHGPILSKGMMIGITGRIQTRTYQNQEGNRVYVTEVVADMVRFLSGKPAGDHVVEQAENGSQGKVGMC